MSAEAVVERFYADFARRDHRAMAAAYAPHARFSDPVFTCLSGPRIGTMWRMLCERATDLRIDGGTVTADAGGVRTTWQAWYTYSSTGRTVHNRIDASFVIEDGLIVRHDDRFDLYRWARQALGMKGVLLGWSPLVQGAIRKQAARSLERFALKVTPGAAGARPPFAG